MQDNPVQENQMDYFYSAEGNINTWDKRLYCSILSEISFFGSIRIRRGQKNCLKTGGSELDYLHVNQCLPDLPVHRAEEA